jgi:3-oxoacyl-[acyl-carrier protein] reductase
MSRDVVFEGADRPFAVEIADALSVHDLLLAVGAGEPPGALIINRAVALTPTAFEAVTDDAFDATLEDSLLGVFDLIQAWVPRLADGAAIVVVTSRAYLGAWGAAPEAAASAALAGFCRTLALELAPRGIRVNVAAADFVDAYASDTAGRARVAEAVAFLASDRSGAISGQVVLLDRGLGLQMREAQVRNLSGP